MYDTDAACYIYMHLVDDVENIMLNIGLQLLLLMAPF